MGTKLTVIDRFNFLGQAVPPVIGSPDGSYPWRKKITGAAPPTLTFAAGLARHALTTDSQAQAVNMYFGDELGYDIDLLHRVTIFARLSAAQLTANVQGFLGVASAIASSDDPDSIAALAGFRFFGAANGGNLVYCESDDGVRDLDDKPTGIVLSTGFKKFNIDFTQGKADVRFSMDNANGLHQRVCDKNVTFDMSGYSSGLQLLTQIKKASSADPGILEVAYIEVERQIV